MLPNSITCLNCGKSIPYDGRVCPYCNANKLESQQAADAKRQAASEEREKLKEDLAAGARSLFSGAKKFAEASAPVARKIISDAKPTPDEVAAAARHWRGILRGFAVGGLVMAIGIVAAIAIGTTGGAAACILGGLVLAVIAFGVTWAVSAKKP